MQETVIVVPCFNEADRLRTDAFADYCARHDWIRFVFVNDGSTDRTLEILEDLARGHPQQIEVLDQQPNAGKAEAVRIGMLRALDSNAGHVGYWDADLSTSLEEIPAFVSTMESHPDCEVVLGSRVKLLGRHVERRAIRHYPGRVFATVASITLRLPVYDTQCGAKLFRASPETRELFQERFVARWIFDVELIARFIRYRRGTDKPRAEEAIRELPLQAWHDIAGSKLKGSDFLSAIAELWRIYWRYMRA